MTEQIKCSFRYIGSFIEDSDFNIYIFGDSIPLLTLILNN